jgi:hypothetical protein
VVKYCITMLMLSLLLVFSQQMSVAQAETGVWSTFAPGGDTLCANGEPYSFHVKPGSEKKLMVFFNGGGGCWSGDVCDVKTKPTHYVPLATLPHNDPRTRDGAFAQNNPDNPFKDWSQVFVSYCTGDVHMGAKDMEYTKSNGEKVLIHHRGKVNAQAALDWIYKNYSSPVRIFVSGGSAGAIAAPYYAALFADHYPDADIIQFSGGAGGYRMGPMTLQFDVWGFSKNMPNWPARDEVKVEVFDDLYRLAARVHPDIKFHQYNTAYDAAQQRFLKLGGGVTAPLYPLLTKNLRELRAEIPYFRSFTAAGDFHTLLRFDELYTRSTDGVQVLDWVSSIADNEDVRDVSCGSADKCR